MNYPRSEKYLTADLMAKIMGPNPIKLEEELLTNPQIPKDATVCDLGSGQGLTSVFLVKEYGFKVIAADLWSDPEENRKFFRKMGLTDEQIVPVNADAGALPFEKEFFDAVVSTDSYNYFGRDPDYLDQKLLPFIKKDGVFVALKGKRADEELSAAKGAMRALSCELIDYDRSTLIDDRGEKSERATLVFSKYAHTDKIYPRKNAAIMKKPL